MKGKHTEGPWEVEPEEASDGRGLAIVAPWNGWIVATILPEDERSLDDIDKANANLIAAAPDLLEALKRITHITDELPDDLGWEMVVEVITGIAQEAIEKVEGR